MQHELPRVSVITVNFNQTELTLDLLKSLRTCGYDNLEIWVVDNASKENPEATILKQYPEVRFIRSEQNLGFAGGNNLAIEKCTGEYLFFINNDAEALPNSINLLVDYLEANTQVGVVSPCICYYPAAQTDPLEIQYLGTTPVHPLTARNRTIGEGTIHHENTPETPYSTAYAHGAAMLLPRRVLDAVGKMPEEFFLYYEELDWCEQIKRAGFSIAVVPQATILHKESRSVGKRSLLQTYYLNRNRVLFMRRNFPGWKMTLFSSFLILVVIPKHLLSFAIKGEWQHFRTFMDAMKWHLKKPLDYTPRLRF